jgi:hypothetical protein
MLVMLLAPLKNFRSWGRRDLDTERFVSAAIGY